MRVSDGGGYGAITGSTYHIKTAPVAPESASQYSATQIEEMFSTLDPEASSQAGSAHTQASRTLADIADSLVQHVQKLSQNWSGTAAESAVAAFGQLHETAVGLSQASAQTGAVLTWLGDTILPFYKSYQAPGNGVVGDVESLFGDNPQDKAAQAVMDRLNNRLVQANSNLPPSVTKTLPTSFAPDRTSAATNNVGSAGAGAGPARRPAAWAEAGAAARFISAGPAAPAARACPAPSAVSRADRRVPSRTWPARPRRLAAVSGPASRAAAVLGRALRLPPAAGRAAAVCSRSAACPAAAQEPARAGSVRRAWAPRAPAWAARAWSATGRSGCPRVTACSSAATG